MPRAQTPAKPLAASRTHTHSAPNWRINIKQRQLVSQVSTIILQRHFKRWNPLLKSLKFCSDDFTPTLFRQIFKKTQAHPKIWLSFFNWAQKNLNFKPDFKAHLEQTRLLFESGLSETGKTILDSIVEHHPPAKIVPLLVQSRKLSDVSIVFNSVIECYVGRGMYLQGLEAYQMAKQWNVQVRLGTCNMLMELLCDKNELRLAWCCYSSIIRSGISGDESTWSLVARILCKDGKFERISRILQMGMCPRDMFDLLIEGYSQRGDFESAFRYMNKMFNKGIEPGFSTYSSMLDGACRYQNIQVIENALSCMIQKGYIKEPCVSDYDSIIEKLCNLGKTYAVDLFFKKACDENIELRHDTYRCILRSLLSKEGRLKDAREIYSLMQERDVNVDESCYKMFVIALSKESPTQEVSKLLTDIARRGFVSEVKELSEYVNKLCTERRWGEAEEILTVTLDQGCLLDSLCCSSLVKHYCSCKRTVIDKAMMLHEKLKGLNGVLDAKAYNVLLASLWKEKRVNEATNVFDYMKACNALSSESFVAMIRGLCDAKELRKAMKLHDEMLEMRLKPDLRTYKRLISGFT